MYIVDPTAACVCGHAHALHLPLAYEHPFDGGLIICTSAFDCQCVGTWGTDGRVTEMPPRAVVERYRTMVRKVSE